ncbi:MAG: hypothetical protein ACYCYJ_10405 [Trichloromonadaceae bacterium]
MSCKKILGSCIISSLLLTLTATQTLAAPEWETRLTVRAGSGENRLSFGQRADATDGFDGQYDVPAMLGGTLNAHFDLEAGPYWRDIKGLQSGQPATWTLEVKSTLKAATVLVSWLNANLPEGTILRDLTTGTQVDMKQQTSYSYSNDGPRQFQLVAGP